MNYSVVNKKGIVENVISADSAVLGELQEALGMSLVPCDGIAVNPMDVYKDGAFFREMDGGLAEIQKQPSFEEHVRQVVDAVVEDMLMRGVI